jgi:uncharacterized protein YjbI with pentapeptide repeats
VTRSSLIALLVFLTGCGGAERVASSPRRLREARMVGTVPHYADLRGADLMGADLSDLSGARLDGARLYGAGLTGVRLHGASVRDLVDLEHAHVESIDVGPPGAPELLEGDAARAWFTGA